MADKESAQDKLAKMIQASAKSADAPADDPAAALAAATGAQPVGAGAKSKKGAKKNPAELIKLLNVVLIVAVVGCLGLLFNQFAVGNSLINSSSEFGADITVKKGLRPNLALPTVQRLSYYLADINSRNIFQPFQREVEETVTKVSDTTRAVARKTRDFRLVGVAWFDSVDSASAMIEDTNKKVTYFLRRGEKIGDVSVKTIYADGVELGYQNEEIIIQYDKSQL